MTDRSKLLALAEAVEKLTGPDRETDTLIYAAVEGWPVEWRGTALVRLTDFYPIGTIDPGEHNRWFSGHVGAPAYTASLDAAMALVPEGCLAEVWRGLDGEGSATASPFKRINLPRAFSATPALALCAAALRAQAEALS